MKRTDPIDIGAVALRLLGDPKEKIGSDWRYGNKRSLSIDVSKNVWIDFETGEGGGPIALIKRESEDDPYDWLKREELVRDVTRTFNFRDEQGTALFREVRVERSDSGKRVKSYLQRPDGRGGWISGKGAINGVRRVLYLLPELIAAALDETVFIAEGPPKADALVKMGLVATSKAGGAGGKWVDEFDELFRDRDVVILPDNDDTSEKNFARPLARRLSGIARRVRVLALPGLAPKGDIVDWIEAGGTRADLLRLVEQTPEWELPNDKDDDDDSADDGRSLPEIEIITGELAANVRKTQAALIAAMQPVLVRAGGLVWPTLSEMPTADSKTTEVTVFRRMTTSNLGVMITGSVAIFVRYDARRKKLVPIDPPAGVLQALLQLGEWDFPHVAGMINAPTMRSDGSILDAPGYDPATALWYWPSKTLVMPPIKAEPTKDEAIAALATWKELLAGYAFVSNLDRAVALAANLTAATRGAYDVAPMVLVVAYDVGSGKSHLVNLTSLLVRGRTCPVITVGPSDEELEKRLASLLLEGAPIISLDNSTRDLGGDLLCQMTEQPNVKVRILGESSTPECQWRGVLFGTGNNIGFAGDMVRRGLLCGLDARVEKPERRAFGFDPHDRMRADRGKYIAALLTIVRAYITSGDKVDCPPIGSFGAWSRFAREPLIWLGEPDPVTSMDKSREEEPGRKAARRLIDQLIGVFGAGQTFRTRELIDKANAVDRDGYLHPELHEALIERCGGRSNPNVIDATRVGHWLKNLRGQVHGGHRISAVTDDKHGARWWVESMDRVGRGTGEMDL